MSEHRHVTHTAHTGEKVAPKSSTSSAVVRQTEGSWHGDLGVRKLQPPHFHSWCPLRVVCCSRLLSDELVVTRVRRGRRPTPSRWAQGCREEPAGQHTHPEAHL